MKLLEIYKERNQNKEWFDKYSSLAEGSYGRLFEYTNTNFRTQSSFARQFEEFVVVEGKERSEWPKVDSHGQERDKQRVKNMLASKLFRKQLKGKVADQNYIYYKTEKGNLYAKFLDDENFSTDEKWILNYIFLLNGYYTNKEKYIFTRTFLIYERFMALGLDHKTLLQLLKDVVVQPLDKYELIKKDFFYLHSFYNDVEFLEMYLHAQTSERGELFEYIRKNLEEENDLCCISKKYKSSGNFSANMLIDESKVFYFSLILKSIDDGDIESITGSLLHEYSSLYPIDNDKVFSFIKENFSILHIVFVEALGVVEEVRERTEVELEPIGVELEEQKPQRYIDDTTIIGSRLARQIFASKKKRAREIANYECLLSKLNNCRYFTSKANNRQYVEVHHLIPQEFRNEFSNSIEVFANYVALCPHCHEMLHKAVDNEKKPSLNYLYSEKKSGLETMGVGVELDALYEFYRIG